MTERPFVCPFCPLHCDDREAVELVTHCELLARRMASTTGRSATASTDPETLATAVAWVSGAETIAVTGHIIDLQTARAVHQAVQRSGAKLVVDDGAGDGYAEALARDGMFSITLGDAAAPHQQVVVIDDDATRLPRLLSRLGRARSIYRWQSIDHLVDRLARLRLSLARPDSVTVDDDPDLIQTRQFCQQQPSVVFAVNIGRSLGHQRRPFWSAMQGLLRELNRNLRAAVLRFDHQMTLRNVVAWSSDGPHHDPLAPSTAVDLEIRFVPWPDLAEGLPGAGVTCGGIESRRRITIGHPLAGHPLVEPHPESPTQAGDVPSIHLDTAVPGVTTDGIVIRGDGSVTLPLRRLVASDLPTMAAVTQHLFAAVPDRQR